MDCHPEFRDLMARVQEGCKESAQILHDRYGHHLLRAVRRRLHQSLRPKFDSLDFVQDVWASFFADVPHKRCFQRPEELVTFLIAMARNKVADTARTRMVRQKYNVNREQPLDGKSWMREMTANVPTPSEVVMGREEWDLLLEGQPRVHRHILALVRDGQEPVGIAQELGISERTVRRVIQKNLPGFQL